MQPFRSDHKTMFRIAKNLVKTFEQGALALSQDSNQIDSFFQSIPPNLLVDQINANLDNNSISGLRILKIDNELFDNCLRSNNVSESNTTYLNSFFDYIVGINDLPLPLINYNNTNTILYPDYNEIFNYLNNLLLQERLSNQKVVKFNIWSAKGGNFRDIYLNLKLDDSNELIDINLDNNSTNNGSMSNMNEIKNNQIFNKIGLFVQWQPLIASTFTYHILQLNITDGPAQNSGLIPDEDYIIGCQDGLLATGGNELLSDIIKSRANSNLTLYVYNKVSDSVRPITVTIGSDGRLGCNIGYGFLHRIPSVKNKPNNNNNNNYIGINNSSDNGLTQVELPLSDETFIPTNINSITPPTFNNTTMKKKKKHSHVVPDGNDNSNKHTAMLDYFQEGKDQNTHGTNKDGTVTPPPILTKQ